MNKKDIKVGVEYAVTKHPAGIGHRSSEEVVKAVVVSLDGQGERMTYRTYGGVYEMKFQQGIEVAWPITIKGSTYVHENGESGRIKKDSNGSAVTKEFTVSYPTRFLDSARYVISTWADWEQRLLDRAAADETRKNAQRAQAQSYTDGDAGNRAKAIAIFEAIEARLGVTVEADLDDTSYNGRDLSLVRADGRKQSFGAVRHERGVNGEDTVAGITFTLSLTTLSTLLGVLDV